ncbi:Rieske 2Fe-2S domain-containing protein [Kitasatospora sp. NPDC057512]|uniref:Rieske 2Fe-2S domain-containing protein n=1 Tax=Kitasatospora sp. NPDC057512 TaxID=3346154 RepID=UPI00367FA2C6
MTRSPFTRTGDTVGHRPQGATERMLKAVDALAEADGLDAVAEPLKRIIRALPLGRARDVLHGLPLGHPLHPALVQIPIGAWTCAAVLDLTPGARRPAHLMVAIGVITAVPSAWSGWVDWAEQHERQRRTGLVHALGVGAAIVLYGGSWAARARHRHGLGRFLGFTGAAAATAGAYLGGHLAYRQGAGTNKTEPVPHLIEPGWHPLGHLADLPLGRPARRTVGDVPLLVVRETEDTVHVLAAWCSHLAGPLTDGEIVAGCVRCPWHGSLFRLADGWNVGGPATAPQPRFQTRTDTDGVLYVRLPEAG